ncbi:negative regulator of sigma-B (phosphoserine phosphatase) [Alkalihalobacillus xiaoxiensis]|uniref:Negative regulator of sigma-B (Phosphoserine phosphatase) n=1 Tax=Shouchella xiaoxiensis TaxID=766895 RepID=A0ABS2STP1_9BACI|nr:negative regulator of sigma-B (phosphoserine phosphatase) [Shouchella xiaoxiensis]
MVTYYKDHYVDIATVQRTKPGNTVCGDAHIVIQSSDYAICAVIDGLGSGKGAHFSAEKAVQAIREYQHESAVEILERCNQALSNERGAVITLVHIDYANNVLTYSNYGNIGFLLHHPDGSTDQPMPKRGYLCGRMQKLTSEQFKYKPGSAFIMFSDGVESLPPIRKLAALSVSNDLISNQLYSVKDDATLMVGKLK